MARSGSKRIGRWALASSLNSRWRLNPRPRRSAPPMHNVLIVDDEVAIRQSLQGVLEDEGYRTAVVASGEACLEEVRHASYDVVLLDIWLPGMDGLEVLPKIREAENAPEVLIISGHGTIETAVRATKLGAFDFLE